MLGAPGYLSSRHTLPLVMISVPWAAAGTFVCLRGLAVKLPWSTRTAWIGCVLSMGLVVVTLVVYQLRPGHASRWGHWAAGRWLTEHATAGDVVLDTRGWARFLSQTPGYDYWHVRQALDRRQALVRRRRSRRDRRFQPPGEDLECNLGVRRDAGSGLPSGRGR